MKSYFLENLQNRPLIEVALNNILPGQTNPWLFKVDNDVCAYFSIENEPGQLSIAADISGRHFEKDDEVVSILKKLQTAVGGEIRSDL